MKRTIEHLTDQFYRQLRDNNVQKVDQLAELNFPDFLVQRLRVKLHTKITDELNQLPDAWINTQAEEVQQTKQLFINAALNNAQLPPADARDVLEQAIDETVKVLVQPRQNIPNVLYGKSTVLTAEELKKRIKKLTVYEHFARVLASYVDRKKQHELTKKQCRKIVADIDQKLCSDLSPQQWAQMLNPLFKLTDNKVSSNLFQLFFSDKNLDEYTRLFANTTQQVRKKQFISRISDLQSDDSKDEQQPVQPATELQTTAESSSSGQPPKKAEAEQPSTQEATSTQRTEKQQDSETQKSTVNVAYAQKQSPSDQSKSLNELFASSQKGKEKKNRPISKEQNQTDSKKSANKPIWQQFAKNNDKQPQDAQEAKQRRDERATNTEVATLSRHLNDKKSLFTQELFNNSSTAYKNSITKIAEQQNWDQAIQIIKNDVFEQNEVDIYSETAVDFIDRLQGYFDEKQTIN